MIKDEETDFLVDTLTAMCIAQYCVQTIELEPPMDMSLQMHDIIKELQERNVEPSVIDKNIRDKDFTNMLTSHGSGNRERGFVMEYIEEVYEEVHG